MTLVTQWDLKGNVPVWMLNLQKGESLKSFAKLKQHLESLAGHAA